MPDRRFAPNGRKLQIQRIWDLHHEIMRLAILGWKPVYIAEHLNITPQTVSNTLGSELCKRQLEVMRGARDSDTVDILDEIKRLAPTALKTIEALMENDPSGRTRLGAAIDILDRAGYAPPKVVEGRFLSAHLTLEDIEDIKNRAMKFNVIGVNPTST